jgi:transposase InsO family protein
VQLPSRTSSTTDQGSQFTGAAFTGALANNSIAISMDGKGAWRDNVFVERLWRSVKYFRRFLFSFVLSRGDFPNMEPSYSITPLCRPARARGEDSQPPFIGV